MMSSVQQGLTFNIPSSFYDVNDEDDFLLENKVNLGQLILFHTCLDKEVLAMKDLLQTNYRDMESLKKLVHCEKLTNRKTLQKEFGKSFGIVYSGEKKDEIESFKFLKQKSLFGQLSSRCYDQESLINMFLTGKEDNKKENIDSILNMSFKLHSSIDQSIGEFQETRKELKVLKDEHSRKEDVIPVSLSQ